MAGHQVTDFARRLRISRAVSGRASEYCRLAEIRCSKCAVSTSCMALVCIELASVRLGEPFDKVGMAFKMPLFSFSLSLCVEAGSETVRSAVK